MKKVILVALLLCALAVCHGAPVDNKDSTKEVQSAFVPAFDEIVVESSLTVRRKNDGSRQGRNKTPPKTVIVTPAPSASSTIASSTTNAIRTKRQYNGFSAFSGFNRPNRPNFSTSIADAHAQANHVNTPFGSFGSSASHSQNQGFAVGSNGLTSSASLSATQHYYFPNGMKIDVNFANGGSSVHNGQTQSAGASSSSVIVTNPSGHKRIFY